MTHPEGQPLRRGFKREEVLAVVAARGRLALPEYLRQKVRYFADGAVLGSRGFVEGILQATRGRFGPRRNTRARAMRVVDAELFTVRDLQVHVLG